MMSQQQTANINPNTNLIYCHKCRQWLAYNYGFKFICCSVCRTVLLSSASVNSIPCSNCRTLLPYSLPPYWLYFQCSSCYSINVRPGAYMREYFCSELVQSRLPGYVQAAVKGLKN